MARQINLYACRDHAERTARRTRRKCASSTAAPARTVKPLTSISMIGDGAVCGSDLATPSAAPRSSISPFRTKTERHPNNCDGLVPISRASAETFAPASQLRAALSALKASDQRRLPPHWRPLDAICNRLDQVKASISRQRRRHGN